MIGDSMTRRIRRLLILLVCSVCAGASFLQTTARANPYLAKPGETPVSVFAATSVTSGGFNHMYTALDQNLFAKYGLTVKHVVIRAGTNINMAALAIDEIQFLYCAGDSTIPGMAAGSDATLFAAPTTSSLPTSTAGNYASWKQSMNRMIPRHFCLPT